MGLHAPSLAELLVIAAIGLLLFGKRLPEVGRSLGKGIVEFKKGLKGIDEEVEAATNRASAAEEKRIAEQTTKVLPAHKFDPYTGKPVEQAEVVEAEHVESH
ncbi:MAG TPA: twin-arginine translocase TatA/TatE family subunit [Tepidisphaeraceae bacterium]|jgi:sec-independent protein translocase protein TatA